MNEWYEQAKSKLEAEKKAGSYDRYASAMKGAVCEALDGFCRQDAEFAQAVVQGGTFADCMKAVAKGCGSAISDLEAFRRAVRFYFPGADVKFHMSAPMRFCNFSPNRDCKKVAGRGVQPLNNYTCRFRPSSLKCTDKSGLDGLQADKWAGN